MAEFEDVFGDTIILDEEIKHVIFKKHPEVRQHFDRTTKTLSEPDIVNQSKTKENILSSWSKKSREISSLRFT